MRIGKSVLMKILKMYPLLPKMLSFELESIQSKETTISDAYPAY